ncbi:Cro/CI family transcriptional regulator [Shewanella sp. YLB-07]|uniref:Cro/CI family transcriptional regulator n=1 Tax=Shewanella sp. YLB-07 TaxID=2601268 RepID=UPI00128D3D6E|nr:Cro/CI family transcriptional regulator [Shewanella sp. YLB-07]MPY24331.1 Cro/Cl family transcriptional regulator [Shewanella sp. YLB-07]
MNTAEAVDYFKGKAKLARALGINPASVSQWGDDVPALRAFQIERLTHGALKVNAVAIDNAKPVNVA